MDHVECPQSEPANNDIQLGPARLVAAANCQGAGGQPRDGGSVFAAAKTGHFDRLAENSHERKIRIPVVIIRGMLKSLPVLAIPMITCAAS